MKVFNFSNGTKGQLLAEVDRVTYNTCMQRVKDPVTGAENYLRVKNERQLGPQTMLTVHEEAGRFDTKYTPEMFGVEAILMCWGQEHSGYGFQEPGDWKWIAIGTPEWVVTALSNGFFVDNE